MFFEVQSIQSFKEYDYFCPLKEKVTPEMVYFLKSPITWALKNEPTLPDRWSRCTF